MYIYLQILGICPCVVYSPFLSTYVHTMYTYEVYLGTRSCAVQFFPLIKYMYNVHILSVFRYMSLCCIFPLVKYCLGSGSDISTAEMKALMERRRRWAVKRGNAYKSNLSWELQNRISLIQCFHSQNFCAIFTKERANFCTKKKNFTESFANFISLKIALFYFYVILFCAILRNKFSVKG